MQISYTLIVALMYVTILSFGIASLLSSLSVIIKKDNGVRVSSLHLQWILLLLLVHFNMTWHAVYLTNVEAWTYYGFIIIILGPVVTFFTATILSPTQGEELTSDKLIEKYMSIKSEVLVLFILTQGWILLSDWVLGRGLVGSAIFNIALILVSFYYKS